MKIKSNTLLKVFVPIAMISAVTIGLKSCDSNNKQQTKTSYSPVVADLTQEELRVLGIEGDTMDDTLRTLVGRIKTVQSKQDILERQNISLVEENAKLRNHNANIDERIKAAVKSAKEEGIQTQQHLQTEQKRLSGLLEDLRSMTSFGESKKRTHEDFPIGLGLEADSTHSSQEHVNRVIWIDPQDGIQVNSLQQKGNVGSFQFPTSFSSLDDNEISRRKAELDRVAKHQQAIEESSQPVYTLPENSTLVGSRSMTALLGRVPIDGKVTDPYPFKVLIGKDNLTANGIELPDVEGAIISGTATGDWVLSCVRGEVTSITFVFRDGTVRTVPKPSQSTESESSQSKNGSRIGWISDENGIPCISGTRKTNASSYIPTLFALSGASAAADTMASNQSTAVIDGSSVIHSFTGNAGQAVLGRALSGGSKDVVAWLQARYGQTFDAVYVPPGASVAVHITRQIAIDYEENGRKVKYDFDITESNELD